jgi:CRP/FNR family transcriptional regulator, cyclic AMP receptor protein
MEFVKREDRLAANNSAGVRDPNRLRRALSRHVIEREFHDKQTIYSQGETADALFSIRSGMVKLSVTSQRGKRAVVRIAREGEIFGEECLLANGLRNATATALEASIVARVPKKSITRIMRLDRAFAKQFVVHLLNRITALEAELVDQILDSSEKRLAKTLLKMAGAGRGATQTDRVLAVDQETLAEMVGTTRSRVSYFMNRFRRLGLIDYNGSLQVHAELLAFLNRK